MKYRKFGNTGINISAVSYGGIVSAGLYDNVLYDSEDQKASDFYVSRAIDAGVNYFDVAPSYGNAELQLGNSLKPYRSDIHIACKTMMRDRAGAEKELTESLKLLHTDYFDVYQMHALTSVEDVEKAFAPGGAMELLSTLKQKGIARNIGITAHSEEAAIRAIQLYDFDTVLFPINWFMNMEHGMGSRLIAEAKQRGMGVLAMKAFIERRWNDDSERKASVFPKSWCKPIDTSDSEFIKAAMKYTLSLGVDTLIPPGNYASFNAALENIDECIENPFGEAEKALLSAKLETVRGLEFF